MTWFKTDDRFPSHRKVRALRSFGARVRADAHMLWHLCGCECSAALGDGGVVEGFVSYADLEATAHPTKPADARAAAAALVSVGLWHVAEGGWTFHDWPEYQPTAEGEKAKRTRWKSEKATQREAKRQQRQSVAVSGADSAPDRQPDAPPLSIQCPALPGPGPDPSEISGGGSLGDLVARTPPATPSQTPPPSLVDAIRHRWGADFAKHRGLPGAPANDTDARKLAAWIGALAQTLGRDPFEILDEVCRAYWADPWSRNRSSRPSLANVLSQADRLAAPLAPKLAAIDPDEWNRKHGLVPARRTA